MMGLRFGISARRVELAFDAAAQSPDMPPAPPSDAFADIDPDEFIEFYDSLSDEDKRTLSQSVADAPMAAPQPGPQTQAFLTPAKVTGFGGQAGGGKTGLIAILAMHHHRTVVFREDAKQLNGLITDLIQFHGTSDGLNRSEGVFKLNPETGQEVWFKGLGKPDEHTKQKGIAFDLQAYDEVNEISDGLEKMVFLKTWNRSAKRGQRCRRLLTFNPPGGPGDKSGAKGRWVIRYFRPWIDERYTDRAPHGEIRYFYSPDKEEERILTYSQPEVIEIGGVKTTRLPESRVFIPASVMQNLYLKDTDYPQTLDSLPEPYRSMMLLGDFRSGITDEEYQLIPTAWIDDAMARWHPSGRYSDMDAVGVDVARGGESASVVSRRHGWWFDKLKSLPGRDSSSGSKVANFVLDHTEGFAEINVDVIGVGCSVYDVLVDKLAYGRINGVDVRKKKGLPARLEEKVKMYNLRTFLYWLARKMLDPASGLEPALPPDDKLRAELISHCYEMAEGVVKVESKEQVKLKTGHSPDRADAFIMSLFNATKTPGFERLMPQALRRKIDYAIINRVPPRVSRTPYGWMAS